MNKITKRLETIEDTEITQKVREAQIRQLYNQTWVGLMGGSVVSISICVALWEAIPQWKLLLWLSISLLFIFMRGFLTFAFQRKAPSGHTIYRWANLHVFGTIASGLMWAVPSVFLWPSHSATHQLVWSICIISTSASAVAMYFIWIPSYISFLSLSVVPISIRLLSEEGLVYIILGLLGLFFTVVLAQTGKMMHDASLRSLIISFRNEALSSLLLEEKTKQEALAIKLQSALDQLSQLSMTDELTGLWNRRFLNATVQEDVAQSIRNYRNIQQEPPKKTIDIDIFFIIIDLDHFKSVNDTYGHSIGDQVLVQMSQLLSSSFRNIDRIIRWGGEEFMMIVRNACRDDYTLLAERVRLAVETHQFDIGIEKPLRLTCSIGIAVFPFLPNWPEALNWDRVLEVADACLYAAKRSGRNAWIGLTPTELATEKDFEVNFTKYVPNLIRDGKLEIKTSLPNNILISWAD